MKQNFDNYLITMKALYGEDISKWPAEARKIYMDFMSMAIEPNKHSVMTLALPPDFTE